MIITNLITGTTYYDTGGDEEILVCSAFWDLLKRGEVFYIGSGRKDDKLHEGDRKLHLMDQDFEEVFRAIANSELGKKVITGEFSVDTKL